MIRKWATKYDTHRALPESVLFSHLKNFIVALEVEGIKICKISIENYLCFFSSR